jgi:hypothetical protein
MTRIIPEVVLVPLLIDMQSFKEWLVDREAREPLLPL